MINKIMAFLNNGMEEIDRNECIGNSLSKINENFLTLDNSLYALSGSFSSLNNVQKIIAGSNILISPTTGTGVVTISSTIT